jgi:rhodanese-related sulfurtransferase
MRIGSVETNGKLVNNVFGMLAATAFVWGVYVFNRPSSMPDVPHIGVAEVVAQRAAGRAPVIVDVRGIDPYGRSHIEGAVHIPLDELQARAKELPADKTAPVVVYCGNGSRLGPLGTAKLQSMGYTHVANLADGLEGWRSSGQPMAVRKS